MKLIVGLGNPSNSYAGTRHNVGFWALKMWAAAHDVSFTAKPKFKAEIADAMIHDERVLLVLPTTFYNLIGESVRTVADFYKLTPSDVLLVHDDIALPLGTIRTRIGGSSGGNNGIKSVNQLYAEQTARLRIGVASDLLTKMDATDFVLGRLTHDELSALEEVGPLISGQINDFISGAFEATTHR